MVRFQPNGRVIFLIFGILVAMSHATNDGFGIPVYPNAQLNNVPEFRLKQFLSEATQMQDNLKNIGRKIFTNIIIPFKIVIKTHNYNKD